MNLTMKIELVMIPVTDVDRAKDEGWGTFVYFADPDGNKWAVQQLP
ncbi:MAG: hypothetical protein U5N21_02195 [Rhodococcus sp. (in: high G+C Gram-positive bacteria)]|nr:hypothetical protein [Rhodococcus sp. (in: high G+C Gram-positive bacteria)]MDZ7928937.1 hypothetical protein [Rhodococcus sp. (in: high G+C Gram-positive bacteria)]